MFANQYLLKGKVINQINQVCAADITYVPMEKGFDYLVTIMNWHSRKMLSWCLSNTMDTDFCVQVFEDVIQDQSCSKIFNTDQGTQLTS